METEKLVEKLQTADSLDDYLDEFGEHCLEGFSFSECYKMLARKKNVKNLAVFDLGQVDRSYGYEIVKGKKKPSRDKVIKICFGLQLSIPEAQLLLRHSGFSPLTPKARRDATVMFALAHGVNLMNANDMLYDNQYEILE